ncbi:MAG: hypothetical protein ACPGVO_06730 [Spirulinaceae cyanobacterium]
MNTQQSFEQILDQVAALPVEQQERLVETIQQGIRAARRLALAAESQEALAEFRAGKLKPLTADEAVTELRAYLDEPEE